MSTINESSQWETDIPLIARMDKVEGGKTGLVNVQTSKLANRTAYLKGELEAYNALIKSGELPFTSEAEAQAAIVQGRIPEGALFSVRSEDARVWAEEFTNAGGQAVATGKKILDGQSFTVTIFPTENDPDGTVTGISATFTGQTFRVVFHDDGGREVLYRNDNGTPIPLSETVGKAAVDAVAASVINIVPLNNTSRFYETGVDGSEFERVIYEDIKIDKEKNMIECLSDGVRMFFVPVWSEKLTGDELEIDGVKIDPKGIPPAILAENLTGLAKASRFLDPDVFQPGGEFESIRDEDIKFDKDNNILECIRDGRRVFFIPVAADDVVTKTFTLDGASRLINPEVFSPGGEMEAWAAYDDIRYDKDGNILSYILAKKQHHLIPHHFDEISADVITVGGVDLNQLLTKNAGSDIPYAQVKDGKSQIFMLTASGEQVQVTDGTASETAPVVDGSGLISWQSDRDATVPGGRFFLDENNIIRPLISRDVLCGWGDSFMENPVFMSTLHQLTGLTAYNFGKSGIRSTAVSARQGGAPFYCAPVNGIIPSGGSVNLAPNLPGPAASASNGTMSGIKCRLAGVDGVFNWTGTQAVFVRDGEGSPVAVSELSPLYIYPVTTSTVKDSVAAGTVYEQHNEAIQVLTFGRNNTASWQEVLHDAQKIIASLKPKGKRFVICPQFTRGDEVKGSEGWQRIHAINAALKSYWPDNYCEIDGVDLLQNFKNHYNPDNETDVKNISDDTTPSSLKYDTLHPSQVLMSGALYIGAEVNARFVYQFMKMKGWVK
ncbi:TPA: hypothetical protein MIU51_13845 [Klebsiella pneumoniae]|nr:hypothetical protein [Klebsiella pneumoniae]